jgi:hypothetical protein
METSNTITGLINELRLGGYTEDFNLLKDCITNAGDRIRLQPEEFVIDKHFRFEGETDPGDEAIVYAISSIKNNVKGILINSYGIYSDEIVDELIIKLKEKH